MINYLKKVISYLISSRIKIITNKKINKIKGNLKANSKNIPSSVVIENLNLWRKIDKNHNAKWLSVYSNVNGIIDHQYISEPTYYDVVEPTLNSASFAEAYSDKNNYTKLFKNEYLPQTLLRRIDGVFYDEHYTFVQDPSDFLESKFLNKKKFVCKESVETGGGMGVTIFKYDNEDWTNESGNKFSINYLNEYLGKNYIIQDFVNQFSFFSQFNPTSVNTIRIFTYRSVTTNNTVPLQAVFRIGMEGSIVDNQASGGISCGVNMETGELNSFAVDKNGNKFHSQNDISFEGQKIPKFDEMKKICIEISKQFPYHRLLGFDLSIDHLNEVKVIEVNNRSNEINFLQMNNGPLFKDYSSEVAEFCLHNKKTVKIDFEI